MRLFIITMMLCLLLSACSSSDDNEVTDIAEQYWYAWHDGNEELMASVLHDRLAKRAVLKIPENGEFPSKQKDTWQDDGYYLHDQGKLILINKTKNRTPTAKREQDADIKLLDRRSNAAIVKISTGGSVDYLQLVRVNKRWYIINVLWAMGN